MISSQQEIKEAITERIAIKDEISKSASYNRGSLSKISQGFRDIGDFILTKSSRNSSTEDSTILHRMKEDLELQIRLYEVEMKKLYRMTCTTESEILYQQRLSESLSKAISEANITIKEREEKHERDLMLNQHMQEYETLAKNCLALPSKRHLAQKIRECQEDINRMENHEAKLKTDIAVRGEKLEACLNILSEMKSGLDDEFMSDAFNTD
jgi:ribosome-binding protein aMBF1 (putative translation factor)